MEFDKITAIVDEIMSGKAAQSQVGSFLTALRIRGETPGEIAAFASIIKRMGFQINPKIDGKLLDTCGTGGDPFKTINVSTIAALVASGAGVRIAKHGGRAVSSKCGSADLLERFGFNMTMKPDDVRRSIEKIGIGFMFAPAFYPMMKQVAGIRKELGFRTIFNLLGPLMNPANADAQLVGVSSPELTSIMAGAAKELGIKEALIVYGMGGLDEITLGRTKYSWLQDAKITEGEFIPNDFGLRSAPLEELAVQNQEEAVRIAARILRGALKKGPKVDIVLINSAAAIRLAGLAQDLREATEIAKESIQSGKALEKLKLLVRYSGGDEAKIETF